MKQTQIFEHDGKTYTSQWEQTAGVLIDNPPWPTADELWQTLGEVSGYSPGKPARSFFPTVADVEQALSKLRTATVAK